MSFRWVRRAGPDERPLSIAATLYVAIDHLDEFVHAGNGKALELTGGECAADAFDETFLMSVTGQALVEDFAGRNI
ncbi:MAG: hypothetical protein R2832_00650 [Rhodothermales bacterium]